MDIWLVYLCSNLLSETQIVKSGGMERDVARDSFKPSAQHEPLKRV